jgi:hypothetical protein
LVLVALVVGWVTLAVYTTRGPDPQEFRKTAAQVAQGALDAVRTARLAGQVAQDGRALRRYLRPVLDNSRAGIGTALRRLAEQSPPGEAERQLRDELRTLLDVADRRLGDLGWAVERGERAPIATAAAMLSPIGDRLSVFVLRQRS